MIQAKKLIGIIVLGVLFSTAATAQNIKSSSINLEGGVVNPTKTLKIFLNKLVNDVKYEVNCKITNSSNSIVYVSITTNGVWQAGTSFLLNGVPYKSTDSQRIAQAPVAAGSNTFVMSNQQNFYYGNGTYSSIDFTNADQDTKLVIDQCYAVVR